MYVECGLHNVNYVDSRINLFCLTHNNISLTTAFSRFFLTTSYNVSYHNGFLTTAFLHGCSMIRCTYNFCLCYRDFQGRNSFDIVNFIIAVVRYACYVHVPERIIKIDRKLT